MFRFVLAARATLIYGAESVLILDLDSACGGATHFLIRDNSRIWQCDVRVCGFDHYEPSERAIEMVPSSGTNISKRLNAELDELAHSAPLFSLCIYNAVWAPLRVPASADYPTEILADRERMAFEWHSCSRAVWERTPELRVSGALAIAD